MPDRTQELVDRADIADVLFRYATALDTREWELLSRVFTDDAECDYGALGRPRGVEAIASLVRSTIGDLDATQHLIGNVVVQVTGDAADAECYLISQHFRAGSQDGEHYLVGGRYQDRLVRTVDGWRIAQRTLHRMWASGNREVVRRAQR